MSTRSSIVMESPDGSFKGIYCHSDGYPSYNGNILLNHYQNRGKVEELIALGDLSVLGENIGEAHDFNARAEDDKQCTAYHRDRAETHRVSEIANFQALCKFAESCGAEYLYVFDKNGQWKWVDVRKYLRHYDGFSDFKDLTQETCDKD